MENERSKDNWFGMSVLYTGSSAFVGKRKRDPRFTKSSIMMYKQRRCFGLTSMCLNIAHGGNVGKKPKGSQNILGPFSFNYSSSIIKTVLFDPSPGSCLQCSSFNIPSSLQQLHVKRL